MPNAKKIILLAATFFFFLALPFPVKAEKINEFSTEITINKDAWIDVSEKIVYDFGLNSRHGIYRDIPVVWTNTAGKTYSLDHILLSVVDENGKPYRYVKSYVDDSLQLKIGDPAKTVSGIHTYVINYRVGGAITYFSDHDELNRNITGNKWEVPIEKVDAIISFPEKITDVGYRTACYSGGFGSRESACQSDIKDNKVFFSTTKSLFAGGNLTVVFGFPKNIVATLEAKEKVSFFSTFAGKIVSFLLFIGFIGWFLVYPIYIIIKWWKTGRDPKPSTGEARAWFEAPKVGSRSMTPVEVGALVDESVDLRDISALIVDLARRGYLMIEERKKNDFYFVKKKEYSQDKTLLSFEQKILQEIFDNKKEIRLKDENLSAEIEKVKKMVYEKLVTDKLFPKNPQSIRTFYTVIAFLGLMTGNIFLFIVALIFGRAMPRKTQAGIDAATVGKSLKNFLSSQERQLEFQAKKQMMFEKLLPFAVAFGVERIWAKRFSSLDIKSPDWYNGYDGRAFNSVLFVNSLDSSLSSFRSVATPTQSSTGFSSGFSGGFSGGGSGGGGGGSW
ncbi:DUF2207 domain-containing protein [Candidatus Roizmanbacteria bacterium]|nr:DUF2207 domain-containing protein [Candidatus Roizmanbacteria bacterium]